MIMPVTSLNPLIQMITELTLNSFKARKREKNRIYTFIRDDFHFFGKSDLTGTVHICLCSAHYRRHLDGCCFGH